MQQKELAGFLRTRREHLQPADVGLHAGARRRTPGLRRHEVADLAGMSPDYYIRLEQARGPQPSPQMLNALSRALRLTTDERDHLYRLAGHHAPPVLGVDEHVSPGLLRLLDALTAIPAQIGSDLGITLAQNRLAVALLGDQVSAFRGMARSHIYRFFTDPAARAQYPAEDQQEQARIMVADVRAAIALRPGDPEAAKMIRALQNSSDEFTTLWQQHDVAVRRSDRKRIVHPSVGTIELDCEVLGTSRQDQRLVILTPRPGSEAVSQLQLLSVIGTQDLAAKARHHRNSHADR
ncbi:helix-turn-helix transcriptional regulator [Actinoplanes sp. DH11]|uniref:helix-turn-helix transcriptional regulator n=1 Tax=Actinoplanes sp. DH11 TaxID=2857011 RepID=UPI001E5EC975|nr:helix-turn-helix transcriptional regulator [Actinoplanes sp. DH11]